MERFDAIIIGAGAAGMFCSALAGQAGRRVLLIDNGKKPGRKILMSGGGRCNFTNLYVGPGAYLSQNPHFCKSALARFTQWDFIDLVNKHGIAWHEKTLGQLFCDDSAQQIVDMLVDECEKGNVAFRLRSEVLSVAKDDTGFTLELNGMTVGCEKLVIATGGLSMPGLGASPFGYKIAEQFGLNVLPTRAGLVPFTLHKPLLEELQVLAGVAAVQPIRMIPLPDQTGAEENIQIPDHTLYGSYPPKIAEDEVKPVQESGEIVLSRVVVPQTIVVHDGVPTNASAKDYYVAYRDYIKNVASSEIYATWPRSTIVANVLAIMSFTLNRVYTEWYRNQGYDFTITSSTAFDHKWIYGRDIFEPISEVVDDIFDNYLSRPGVWKLSVQTQCKTADPHPVL